MEGIPDSGFDIRADKTQAESSSVLPPDNDLAARQSEANPNIPRNALAPEAKSIAGRAVVLPPEARLDGLYRMQATMKCFTQEFQLVAESWDVSADTLPSHLQKLNDWILAGLADKARLMLATVDDADYSQCQKLADELSHFQQLMAALATEQPFVSEVALGKLHDYHQQLLSVSESFSELQGKHYSFATELAELHGMIQKASDHLSILGDSARQTYQSATSYLDKLELLLARAEMDMQSLSLDAVPLSIPGSASPDPARDRPSLEPPVNMDMPKTMRNIRFGLEDMKSELNKYPLDLGLYHSVIGEVGEHLETLKGMTDKVELGMLEVHRKSCLPITWSDLAAGLAKLASSGSSGLSSGLKRVCHGVMALWKRGTAGLKRLNWIAPGSASVIMQLVRGIRDLGKEVGHYGTVTLLIPLFIVRKLFFEDNSVKAPSDAVRSPADDTPKPPEPWWTPFFSEDPEGVPDIIERAKPASPPEETDDDDLSMFDPLKNESLRQSMLESMKRYPELSHITSASQISAPDIEEDHSIQRRLEGVASRLDQLAEEMLSKHLGLQQTALNEYRSMMSELASIEVRVRSQVMTTVNKEIALEQVGHCWQKVREHSEVLPAVFHAYQPYRGDVLVRSLGGRVLDEEVLQCVDNPEHLAQFFASSRAVDDFLKRRLPRYSRQITSDRYQLLEDELLQLMAVMNEREASYDALQAFERRFHGKFGQEHTSPSMKPNREEMVAEVQVSLVKAKNQLNQQLAELTARQSATSCADLSTIRQTEQSRQLLAIILDHLDSSELVARNLQYFVGNDLNESDIEVRLAAVEEQLDTIELQLTRSEVPVRELETRLAELNTMISMHKSRLSDMYFQGWVTQDGPGFNKLEEVRDKSKQVHHLLVRRYEKVTDLEPEHARQGIISTLQSLSDSLKAELPDSKRVPLIERILNYLKDNNEYWSPLSWLELNWLCNQDEARMSDPLYKFYPTVQQCAKSCGGQMVAQLKEEAVAFDLCSPGELKDVAMNLWQEWNRDHPTRIGQMLTSKVLTKVLTEVLTKDLPIDSLLILRERVSSVIERRCDSLSRGISKPEQDTIAMTLFFRELHTKVASRNQIIKQQCLSHSLTVKEATLKTSLEKLAEARDSGQEALFPLLARLAELTRTGALPQTLDFDGICQWTEKCTGKVISAEDKHQLMALYMQYRTRLLHEPRSQRL